MNKVREDKIRGLLVRYMEGESSQEEQRVLKEFFRNAENLPADLEPYAQLFAFCFVTSENGAASAVEREDSKRTPACVPNAAAANVGAPAPEGCVAVAEPVDAAHDVTGEPSASVAASESAVQRSVGAGTSYTTSGTGATISPSRLPGRSTKLLTALELSTYLASSSHVREPCSPTVSTRSG